MYAAEISGIGASAPRMRWGTPKDITRSSLRGAKRRLAGFAFTNLVRPTMREVTTPVTSARSISR